MIYFIQAGENGPIKIGLAIQPETRKKKLQTAHYEELRIIGILDGNEETEKQLHMQFAEYRIRGEWFHPSHEILQFIDKNTQPVGKNLTQNLGDGQYRIIFHTPVKASVKALIIFGNHPLKVVLDREREWILGIQGTAAILKEALPDLGVTPAVMREYLDVLEEQ
jgi:Meiotically up-regulated gene 113